MMECSFDWAMALEYLKVILSSWPTLAVVLIGSFVWKSRKGIGDFVSKHQISQISKEGVNFQAQTQTAVNFSMDLGSTEIKSANAGESEASRGSDDSGGIQRLTEENQRLKRDVYFEMIFRLIYGSQTNLLRWLSRQVQGSSKTDLKAFYQEHLSKGGASNYPYELYLGFLVRNGLIEMEKNNYCVITSLGKDFLEYIVRYPAEAYSRPY
ncbi:MAG: winged helix-turn-helix domain-containing protein [Burkholderiales bacterium]|jgi:hypothetical protein|nr:winged helix-turn-helix domain-containing protein [Burkholderiales bacterium]